MSVSERFLGANVVDAGQRSPYWGEHAARYTFALPYVEGKAVMDIACGTGYGIGVLQTKAKRVVGVDVNIEAAQSARRECSDRSDVLLGDGLQLPFGDESFDVITSFETLEHLYERKLFLSELRRVLKPHGVLILSTPNANYTQPVDGKPANPFHVFEYRPEELLPELEQFFHVSAFHGQYLDSDRRIPPFHDAQQKLSDDLYTQISLLCWKAANKLSMKVRERLSQVLWKRPFYPTENEYTFSAAAVESAPVLVAVCENRE